MTKALITRSSFENSRLDRPEQPETFPPTKGEPGSTNHSQTHIAGSPNPGPPKPSNGGPAPICTCGQELGYIPACQIGDEEFDSVIFTKRCEIHEKDKHGDFLEELEDFNQPRLRLTMEGLKMQMRLYREKNSDLAVKSNQKGGSNP